jgi:hypothetical protein
MNQSTHMLLMVRPSSFRKNEETTDNAFQASGIHYGAEIQQKSQTEFDELVTVLRSKGVKIQVFDALEEADTPDALFPNNWLSFHDDRRAAVYPMRAPNRRRERREDFIFELCNSFGLELDEIIDFTEFESHDRYLEGTGSMVLDRVHRICYAALSLRTDLHAASLWCESFGYQLIAFHTAPEHPVYHTNVMMSIGTDFAVFCPDVIHLPSDREVVRKALKSSGRELLEVSETQMGCFACNLLEVKNEEGRTLIVMSQTGYDSFDTNQRDVLGKYGSLVVCPIPTIETYGGGSVRCMLCEVFLPKI